MTATDHGRTPPAPTLSGSVLSVACLDIGHVAGRASHASGRSRPSPSVLTHQEGDLIAVEDERAFTALTCGSAAMSTVLALKNAIADWITARGAPAEGAATYVRSLFHSLSETAARTAVCDLPDLIGRPETPGGLNERVRRRLESGGWFDAVGEAFDEILSLRRTDLGKEDAG
jgi:pyrroline-5-carboxylate reductase